MRVLTPLLPSRERKRPVLNPALALGARISGAELRMMIQADVVTQQASKGGCPCATLRGMLGYAAALLIDVVAALWQFGLRLRACVATLNA